MRLPPTCSATPSSTHVMTCNMGEATGLDKGAHARSPVVGLLTHRGGTRGASVQLREGCAADARGVTAWC